MDNWLDISRRGDGGGGRKARIRERKKVLNVDIGPGAVGLVTEHGELFAFGFGGEFGMFKNSAERSVTWQCPHVYEADWKTIVLFMCESATALPQCSRQQGESGP
jgi:hypothetical protein